MNGWAIKRILHLLPTLLGVVTLSFLLLHLTPGDPIDVLLGERAAPADREAMRAALGLDKPLLIQYGEFLVRLLHFDLGTSFSFDRPVAALIGERLGATAVLALAGFFYAVCAALPLGVWAAARKGHWPDTAALGFSMAGFAMPSFWLGPLLIIIFSLWLGWLPISGNDGLLSLILPAITLGTGMAAFTGRMVRNTVLETLRMDYIRTARAKGCSERQVMWHHALRNALLPIVTVLFLQLGALLTGAIITETVFNWPGIGGLLIEAIHRRDYPVVQGCLLFIAFVYMMMTFLSDIVCVFLDPRLREERS